MSDYTQLYDPEDEWEVNESGLEAYLKRLVQYRQLQLSLVQVRLNAFHLKEHVASLQRENHSIRGDLMKVDQLRARAETRCQEILVDLRKLLVVPAEMSSGDLQAFYDNVRELYATYNAS